MQHKGTQEINTERLLLRKFTENDAQDMFDNWTNDEQVTRFLSWSAHKSIEVSKKIIAKWIDAYSNLENYNWSIVPKEYGKVIGSISVMTISNNHEHCEIGYCIGRTFWGKGIVAEALEGVINYLFKEVGFERIAAYHHSENVASGKVMKKAGMKYEGKLRNYHKNQRGTFVDCDLYSILREEIK